MAEKKILILTVLLIIVLALIGILLVDVYDLNKEETTDDMEALGPSEQIIYEEITTMQKQVSLKKQIVTDRFTETIDKDGIVIIVDDSNAYYVRKGIVLVDDNLIKVSDEEYTVDFTEAPRRIISSE